MTLKPVPISKAKTAYGLFTDIKKVILAEPRRIYMDIWSRDLRIEKEDEKGFITDDVEKTYIQRKMQDGPACGIVGCIGGWGETLNAELFERFNTACYDLWDHNNTVSTNKMGKAKDQLFFTWYRAKGSSLKKLKYGTKAYARQVVREIEKFQKEFAKELKAIR